MKRRRSARKRVFFRAKVKIDMSEWLLGEWPETIAEAVTVKKDSPGRFTISLSEEAAEHAARQIAQDAVKAFFEEGLSLDATEAGIAILDSESLDPVAVIPWYMIWVEPAGMAAVQKWVADQKAEIEEGAEA